ncbi:cobalt ECF transporter T component CbiQ [Magnetospirillum moscoviense]|nr:cobalt ECF transporter T component CbiQ [Magnetospirillum moscoviense]
MSLPHAHSRTARPMLGGEAHGHASLHDDCEGHGPIGHLDPRTRLVAAGLFALMVVSRDQIWPLVLAVGLALAAALLARLRVLPTLRRMLAMDGFMVAAVALLPFTVPGDPAFSAFGLTGSGEGLHQAALILLKANAVVLMLLALVGSMNTIALGHALARLGLPCKLVQLFLFTVRYLDLLHREYARLRTAMKARAFTMGTNRHTWQSVGYLFGMLMVRSLERSDRILAAMRLRGFDGHFPCLEEPSRFGRPDGLFALASAASVVLMMSQG